MKEITINDRWNLLLPEHREEMWDRMWEEEKLNSIAINVRSTDIVFEAGAEEGDQSALFASWSKGIVLTEPSERYWPNIKAVFEANHLQSKVLFAFAGFFGDEIRTHGNPFHGDAPLWPKCSDGPISTEGGFCNIGERPDISIITIDDTVMKLRTHPDVIIMDVEGSELKVLKGAYRTLWRHHPLVYVSVHPEFMIEMYGETREELIGYMLDLDYTYRVLANEHEIQFLFYPKEHKIKNGVVMR